MAEPPRKTPPQQSPPASKQASPRQQPTAKEPRPRIEDLRALVQRRMQPTLVTLLGKNADVARWGQVFLSALTTSGDLMRCTDASIARALLHSAEVGLMPGGAYPHCYLIPYWNPHALGENRGAHEVQFQISVWGYTELVRRAGVRKVWADVVRVNDPFECISGTDGKQIKHRPNWFASDEERGEIIGSYACAMLENGETVCEPASYADIENARKQNRGKSPAWDLWYEQQAQKVALKRLSKYLPKGKMPDRALELDEDPGTTSVIDVPGMEVPGNVAGGASSPQSALDEAVARARSETQQQQPAANGNASPTIDRNRLHQMLIELDERWKNLRGRVDGWDEMQALAATAALHALMRYEGSGDPPELPPHLRLDDASEVIS